MVTAMWFRFDAPRSVRLLTPKVERSCGKEHAFVLDLIATLTQARYGYAEHAKGLDNLVERPLCEIEREIAQMWRHMEGISEGENEKRPGRIPTSDASQSGFGLRQSPSRERSYQGA